jgi:hypothetical protein
MTPDLYDAWLTAGNNLQPIGDWLAAHWPPLAILAALLAFAAWAIRRYIRGGTDYRTRNDRVMARRYATYRPTPERQQPGTDRQLYLDCIAVYGEHPDQTLSNQQRKEKPQP